MAVETLVRFGAAPRIFLLLLGPKNLKSTFLPGRKDIEVKYTRENVSLRLAISSFACLLCSCFGDRGFAMFLSPNHFSAAQVYIIARLTAVGYYIRTLHQAPGLAIL